MKRPNYDFGGFVIGHNINVALQMEFFLVRFISHVHLEKEYLKREGPGPHL